MLKSCSKCGEEKETDAQAFSRESRAKDGWDSQCKECRRAWRMERRGLHPVKLIRLQGPALTPSQRQEAKTLESLHCRVFVSNGRHVQRFGQAWRGWIPVEEWMEKFEGRFDEVEQ